MVLVRERKGTVRAARTYRFGHYLTKRLQQHASQHALESQYSLVTRAAVHDRRERFSILRDPVETLVNRWSRSESR